MSTVRRDTLVAIEKTAQAQWEEKKLNEWDAPPAGESRPPKFFTTFPFPYMNGTLHLGHAFSLTKSEFASRFERMMGKRSLWAFAFHVTGMPIAACANKIAKEMEKYGNPPVFPAELLDDAPPSDAAPAPQKAEAPQGKFKSKRGKSGPAKPQWLIMKQMGISEEDIPKFADPLHWLDYFPPIAMDDLKGFGCHIDFRRSFATTERCPFFDRFVKWQFDILFAKKYLNYGKRYCVYSPMDGQPCADHDRAAGEGVLPQEYTVVKLRVQDPLTLEAFRPFQKVIGDKRVIFPCATLRAETLIGQTNCWVSPNFAYKAYAVKNVKGEEEIFLMTGRAARNLAYQDFTINGKTNEDPAPLFEIHGKELIGIPLSAPLAQYDTIYSLPMATIAENKGTGVVMSVPSDSPDDYVNFTQLINKPDYRVKLGIKDEWVLPFKMIPIIDIPDLGVEGAKYMCEKLRINGPNAKDLLEEAKKVCYQKGFYYGVMIEGPFKGQKVSDAKNLSQKVLEEQDDAIRYYEPMGLVLSRSGDECVVALQNQWYIEYGKSEEWREMVRDHLSKNVNTFFPSVRNGFDETLNWLSDWPCSRTFGLGTHLPADATHTMLIDSLSDSTIYMAYYTIAKFLHTDVEGKFALFADRPNKNGLTPEMFTQTTFDFIFLGKGSAAEVAAEVGMPVDLLQQMRNEFEYWYPVDLRCSGKDLIQNHLTMFLYNHAAIWSEDSSKWPRGIFCNGHVQVDNEKMAKSKGNFISLRDAIETYGSDATRLACADAGDTLDDANFVRETASGFVLKLTTIIQQAQEALRDTSMRSGDFGLFDRIFSNVINEIILKTKSYYQSMQFRLVLNVAFHELTTEFSQYKQCTVNDVHKDLVRRFYEVLALLLMPLAPHFSEHLWQNILHMEGNVVTQPFPVCDAPVTFALRVSHRIIKDVTKDIRAQIIKLSKKHGGMDSAVVYVATEYADWQKQVLVMLNNIYVTNNQSIPVEVSKLVLQSKPEWLTKQLIPETMAFLNFMRLHVENYGVDALDVNPAVNDYDLLSGITINLAKLSGISTVEVLLSTDTSYEEHKVIRSRSRPGEPTVAFRAAPKV